MDHRNIITLAYDAHGLGVPVTPEWSIVSGEGTLTRRADGSIDYNSTKTRGSALLKVSAGALQDTFRIYITGSVGFESDLAYRAEYAVMGTSVTCNGFAYSTINGKVGTWEAAVMGPCSSGPQTVKDYTGIYSLWLAGSRMTYVPCDVEMSAARSSRTYGSGSGVMCWNQGIAGGLGTLVIDAKGDSSQFFLLRIAGSATFVDGDTLMLRGGAQAKHVYWYVDGHTDINTGASLQGTILAEANIGVGSNVIVNGRLFASHGGVWLGGGSRIDLP